MYVYASSSNRKLLGPSQMWELHICMHAVSTEAQESRFELSRISPNLAQADLPNLEGPESSDLSPLSNYFLETHF